MAKKMRDEDIKFVEKARERRIQQEQNEYAAVNDLVIQKSALLAQDKIKIRDQIQTMKRVALPKLQQIKIKPIDRTHVNSHYEDEPLHNTMVGNFLFRCQTTAQWMSWSELEREVVLAALQSARKEHQKNPQNTLREHFHAKWYLVMDTLTNTMLEVTKAEQDDQGGDSVLYINLIMDILIQLFCHNERPSSSHSEDCDDFWQNRFMHLMRVINAVANPNRDPRKLDECLEANNLNAFLDESKNMLYMDTTKAKEEHDKMYTQLSQ